MFLTVGHRGAKAHAVENTLESFQKAIELGANAVEFDVRRTKDGALVLSHDDTLKRVFGAAAPVGGSTLRELKALTGGRLPTLEEALRFIDGKVEKLLVELKEPGYEKEVLDTVKSAHLQDRVVLISFHEEALAAVRELDRSVATGLIYSKHKNPIAAALGLKAQYLVPLFRLVHTRNVQDAHKNNLKVIVWTVNTEKEAADCRAKGVDGIASDRPEVVAHPERS